MADDVVASIGTEDGVTFATDEDTSVSPARHFAGSKIMLGANGVFTAYWDGTVANGGTWVTQSVCTNAGTFVVQVNGDALTALQLIDDIVYVDDADWTATTSKHALVGGIYQSTLGTITDGDTGPLRLDVNGVAYVHPKSFISTANSSSATLGIDAVFTGTAEDVSDYSAVSVMVDSNVASATDGVSFEWSSDGTNWDKTETHTLTGGVPLNHSFGPEAQFLRIVYTNGGTGQAHMRLQTVLHATALGPRSESLNRNLHTDDLAVTTRSVIAAFNGTGYENIQSTAGNNLKVSIEEIDGAASLPVTNAGLFVVQVDGAALTALQKIDDPVQMLGTDTYLEGTDSGMLIGVVRNDTLAALADTDNEIAPLQVNATGALYVDGSGFTQPVSGTVTANPASGTIDTVTTVSTVTNLSQMGGVAISLNTGVRDTGTQRVTIATDDLVPITGTITAVTDITNTIDSTISGNALIALQLIDNSIVAHDAAVSGSTGVNVTGFEARSTVSTAVADADATRGIATLTGKQVVQPYSIPAASWHYAPTAAIADAAEDVAKTAAGVGIFNYITRLQVINGHATVSTQVQILDGAGGTPLWTGWAQAAGGGVSAKFDPPLRPAAANTAINIVCGTTGSATYFNLQGYEAAE